MQSDKRSSQLLDLEISVAHKVINNLIGDYFVSQSQAVKSHPVGSSETSNEVNQSRLAFEVFTQQELLAAKQKISALEDELKEKERMVGALATRLQLLGAPRTKYIAVTPKGVSAEFEKQLQDIINSPSFRIGKAITSCTRLVPGVDSLYRQIKKTLRPNAASPKA